MPDRLVSLSVGTNSEEQWAHAYRIMSQLGAELGRTHSYVGLSSSETDEIDILPEPEVESLSYDALTMTKVRDAIRGSLARYIQITNIGRVSADTLVEDIVNEIHNSGIVFRERV